MEQQGLGIQVQQQVVGVQQGSIPNAAVGTEVAVINSILTAMRNHGLIAP